MRYCIILLLLFMSEVASASSPFKGLSDKALKDIQSEIKELAEVTDKETAKVFADSLTKRIDREAFLVSRREQLVKDTLSTLYKQIEKQNQIIADYALLVEELEKRIKELENE